MKFEMEMTPEGLAQMCQEGQICPRLIIGFLQKISVLTQEEQEILNKTDKFNGFCNPFRHGECQSKTANIWRDYLNSKGVKE